MEERGFVVDGHHFLAPPSLLFNEACTWAHLSLCMLLSKHALLEWWLTLEKILRWFAKSYKNLEHIYKFTFFDFLMHCTLQSHSNAVTIAHSVLAQLSAESIHFYSNLFYLSWIPYVGQQIVFQDKWNKLPIKLWLYHTSEVNLWNEPVASIHCTMSIGFCSTDVMSDMFCSVRPNRMRVFAGR